MLLLVTGSMSACMFSLNGFSRHCFSQSMLWLREVCQQPDVQDPGCSRIAVLYAGLLCCAVTQGGQGPLCCGLADAGAAKCEMMALTSPSKDRPDKRPGERNWCTRSYTSSCTTSYTSFGDLPICGVRPICC
jgi:hypothetical protein